jgi:hypothetical protein
MATILTNAFISVDAQDLSQYAKSVTVSSEDDDVDVTGFNAAGVKQVAAGLRSAEISITFNQDVSGVDDILWPIHANREVVEIIVKPNDAAVSATNPSYTMQGVLLTYSPIDGDVGDVSTTEVTFANADPSGIVRDATGA